MRYILNKLLNLFGYRLIKISSIEEDISDLDIIKNIYKEKLKNDSEIISNFFDKYCGWKDNNNK